MEAPDASFDGNEKPSPFLSQAATRPTAEAYMPRLDGIRAVAILAVLSAHFLPVESTIGRLAEWGRLGVVLFFTLSGFLITGILLRYRDVRGPGASVWKGLRTFYARRFLRIFPIYYLTLGVLAVGGYVYVRQYLIWHASYTSNISIAYFGGLYGYSVHLWSLCVEEQFYLVWPCLVMFAPKRFLPMGTWAIILGSILFKAIGTYAGLSPLKTTFTLFGCLDSLALGAALAIAKHDLGHNQVVAKYLWRTALLMGLPLFVLLQMLLVVRGPTFQFSILYIATVDSASALMLLPFLYSANARAPFLLAKVLEWSPIRYLGKISYGIYLFHFFLVPVCVKAMHRIGWDIPDRGYAMFIMGTSLSVALAAISWQVFESPINGLKRYFQYPSRSDHESGKQAAVPRRQAA